MASVVSLGFLFRHFQAYTEVHLSIMIVCTVNPHYLWLSFSVPKLRY